MGMNLLLHLPFQGIYTYSKYMHLAKGNVNTTVLILSGDKGQLCPQKKGCLLFCSSSSVWVHILYFYKIIHWPQWHLLTVFWYEQQVFQKLHSIVFLKLFWISFGGRYVSSSGCVTQVLHIQFGPAGQCLLWTLPWELKHRDFEVFLVLLSMF